MSKIYLFSSIGELWGLLHLLAKMLSTLSRTCSGRFLQRALEVERVSVGPKRFPISTWRRAASGFVGDNCRQLPAAELDERVAEAHRDGFTVLRDFIPQNKIEVLSGILLSMLQKRIEQGNAERGANRWYVTPPFRAPIADEAIFADPGLLYIVEKLVGDDPVMCQWASDTPLKGSEYQEIHRDTAPLFEGDPDWTAEPPMYQLGVNFPLCDVLELAKGPVEVMRGTHRLPLHESEKMKAEGRVVLEPVFLAKGDLMVRDVRGLHRGTPNSTDEPRIMVVIGYSRKWLRRPEVSIAVPESVWDSLSNVSQRLLRFEPVLPDADIGEYTGVEGYDSKALKKASGKSFKGEM